MIMSNSQNTELLENLFEEEKASLINKGMHLIFSSEEIENCAGRIARSKFEDLCQ
tara:strand:+ start:636 stop:800 length:165 start_codon:yes stop_codon:yes gene_type:complete